MPGQPDSGKEIGKRGFGIEVGTQLRAIEARESFAHFTELGCCASFAFDLVRGMIGTCNRAGHSTSQCNVQVPRVLGL